MAAATTGSPNTSPQRPKGLFDVTMRTCVVAGRDQLEEQVGGLAVEGDVADLVDDEERDPSEAGELVVQVTLLVGLTETRHPLAAVAKATRWPAWHARMPSPVARWVLPVPAAPRTRRCPWPR